MLLMDVVRDDTMKVPAFEHQIYRCSACRHIARRLVFSRPKMPITHLPVTQSPEKFSDGRREHLAPLDSVYRSLEARSAGAKRLP